jgi:hypothetical protein
MVCLRTLHINLDTMIRVEAIEWGDGVKAYKYKVVYLFGIPIYTYNFSTQARNSVGQFAINMPRSIVKGFNNENKSKRNNRRVQS